MLEVLNGIETECQWGFQGQQVRTGVSDCPNWSRVDQGQWQKDTPGGLTFDYTFIVTLFVNGKQPLTSSLRYKNISGQLTCGDIVGECYLIFFFFS